MVQYAEDFVEQHPELSAETKEAILHQKVIIGMYPDEAHAAGGGFSYAITDAPGYNEPHDFYPPGLIFSQKEKPTPQLIIKMGFKNKTQFDSEEPIGFWVYFENGKAVRIERVNY